MAIKIGSHKPHVIAFLCGLVAHVLLWFLVVGFNMHRLCEESGCWSLIILDVPASFLYAESNYSVTYGSLLLGSVWWGVLWGLLYSLFIYIKSATLVSSEAGDITMSNVESTRVKCSGVVYRQGWVEVASNIHAGRVNLEVWSVAPEVDMSVHSMSLASVPDKAVTGNVEVELTVAQAKTLVGLLQGAIEAAEHATSA